MLVSSRDTVEHLMPRIVLFHVRPKERLDQQLSMQTSWVRNHTLNECRQTQEPFPMPRLWKPLIKDRTVVRA